MESNTFSESDYPNELQNAIAVVGMSCRFPESDNVDEFWDFLVNGKDGISEPPNWRWVGDEHLAQDPDVRKQKAGFLKCSVDEFDTKFFGMSPREAEMTDPQQRLLLEVTWESLENAGINPLTLRGTRTGVFTGVWRHDYERIMLLHSPNHLIGYHEDFMGNSFSAISGRIAYQLGLTGPNIATESGCASSTLSVHLACQSLTLKETDLAIVGGVNLLLYPFTLQSMKAKHVLSPDGKCKTFDASADGYGRAEGCASLVLKRYPDAVENGDRVLALIRGSAMGQEGVSTSFGTPTKEGQAACIKAAVKRAGISPNMISYVEAHGTGTVTGDPVEIAAVTEVYSADRHEPLWIGSVKTNIGHTESCAGLAGIIKVILSLQHKTIPPHINCYNLNPKIDLAAIPARLPKEAVEWKKYGDAPRMAGVNSFGMTGANVHFIIQEAPTFNGAPLDSINSKKEEGESYQIVTISARSENSLQELAIRYKQFLKTQSEDFNNFCYTANVCRAKWNRRIAVIGKNAEEITNSLEKSTWIKKKDISPNAKVVFLFTGQGSQYVGMGETLYKNNTLFRQNFDKCSKIVEKQINIVLPNLLWSNNYESGKDKSFYDQISIFCIEYCLWKLWEHLGITPDIILGHSIGEFAASVAAGILRFEDALHLLIERSKLIDALPNGQMLAVKAGIDTVNGLIRILLEKNNSDWLDVAAINSDTQTVVTGRNETVKLFGEFCSDNSIKSTLITSKRAYHSRDMDLILPAFDKILSKVSFGIPKYIYISSTTGNMVTDNEIDKDYWKRNTRMAVNFKKAFDLVLEQGGRIFVEIGPQPVLINIGDSIASTDISKKCLWVPSMKRSGDEWKTFLEGVGHLFVNGFDIDWKSLYENKNKKIAIPTYPFDHTGKYWFERQPKISANGKSVHPLIGIKNCIPNTEKFYHQQDFKLNSLGYVRDHVIVNKVIVPGACFLEMIISAGHSIQSKSADDLSRPVIPMVVTDLNIKAALELQEGLHCTLYIEGDSKYDEGYCKTHLNVSRKIVDDCDQVSWITHATGTFSCSQETNDCVLDLEHIKTISTYRNSTEMYSSVDKVGLNFGTSFRSIKNIWENDKEILAEIQVDENCEGYNLHPIIMDGMLQSLILSPRFCGTLKHLALPTAIKKFVIFPTKSEYGKTFYAYILKEDFSTVKLYDEFGKPVATAEGIIFTETSGSQFIKALNSQTLSLPALHEVVWRKATNDGLEDPQYSQDVSPKNSMWLIFADGNLSNTLKQKLEDDGKSVTMVNRGVTYSETNNEYIIDPNDLSGVTSIFDNLNTSNLEGIIYMWGLNSEKRIVDQNNFCKPFLAITQKLITSNFCKRLILVTKGDISVDRGNVNNPAVGTLLGLFKSAKAEQPGLHFKSIDLDPVNHDLSLDANEIVSLMNNNKDTFQYASRKQILFTPKLEKLNLPHNVEIPVSSKFSLNVPISNSITDLSFSPFQVTSNMKEKEIEISVIAVALNFRDIMVIMKPEGYYTKYPLGIGSDFSGIVTKVGSAATKFGIGDSVFGIAFNGALGSHAITHEGNVIKKPKEMTHFEAACLPVVLCTAFYTIVNIGQVSSKDTILIHAASGGVGLIAIQIVQKIGAKIIVTAGSERKRLYLKSLGIKHVFNSRSTDYGQDIVRVTEGKGVDVVLNTLTGANFKETTLSVCSQNARFIEISKANIWQPEDVAALRPDVQYTLFDLEQLDDETIRAILPKVNEYQPIPYTRFELGHAKEAFKYLQKAQHVGKVVIAVPQFEIEEGKPKSISNLFNEDSTYVITGGLGGKIGLEVAKWMLSFGAKFIVLVGRKLPNETTSKIIQNLNAEGANVIAFQADVGIYEDCQKLFDAIKNNLPPLRGIMHAAGVLADAVIENQTWKNFEKTFWPKVNGTWNLHELSLGYNLEHFVLFSSIASTIGSIGQSNYIAANAFLDSFVHFRIGLGLPAQCINWGAWLEVGMAANSSHFVDDFYGTTPFSTKRGLSALKSIMQSNYSQITVSDIQPSITLRSFPHLKQYLSELTTVSKTKESHKNVHLKDGISILDEIKNKTLEDKLSIIRSAVMSIVSNILKLDESDSANYTESFVDLGLDSLTTVELRNGLQELLPERVIVSSSTFLDYSSPEAMSNYVLNTISPNSESLESEADLGLHEIVKMDCNLCSDLKVSQTFQRPQNFQNILLTGVTGNLGPYMLQELVRANPIATIFCIVRAKSISLAENRVRSTLQKHNMDESILENCIVFNGDIGDEYFTLDKEKFFELSETIEAVVHLAVKTNHVEEYKKRSGKKNNDIRSVNVIGTKNILQFAATKRNKYVFHASSFVATTKKTFAEEFPGDDNFGEGITMGYAVSKFISEKLMKQASDRGIHCIVLRYPMIMGNSETGQFFYESDHLMMGLLSCLRANILPRFLLSIDMPFIPVEIAARISVKMIMDPDTSLGVYNFVGPDIWSAFYRVAAEFGHQLELIDDATFHKTIINEWQNSFLMGMEEIYHREQGLKHFLDSIQFFSLGLSNHEIKQSCTKFYKCITETDRLISNGVEFLTQYMQYAKTNGILDK